MQFLPGFSSFSCSPHALLECSLSVSSCHDVRIPTHMECDTSQQSRLSIVFNSDQPPDMCMKKPPDNSNPPSHVVFPAEALDTLEQKKAIATLGDNSPWVFHISACLVRKSTDCLCSRPSFTKEERDCTSL